MTNPINSLPPLPLAALKRVQQLQKATERALKDCGYPGTRTLDVRKAFEVMRASVVEELNIRLDYFETLTGFDWEWMEDILAHATASVLACFPSRQFERRDDKNILIAYEGDQQFLSELARTGWDYAVERRLSSQRAALPIRASVQPEDRRALAAAYRAAFPDVRIKDIVWAAKQTRREWTRWLGGDAPNGLKADRCFRHVLTSGKTPEEIMGKPRPTKSNS